MLQIRGTSCLQKTMKLMHTPKKRVARSGIPIAPSSSSPADNKALLNLYTTPPEAYMQINTEKEGLYVHLLFALKDEYLGIIEANFVSIVCHAFVFLENNWSHLCDDIRKGQITHIQLDPALLTALNKALRGPDPSRASRLEKEFEKGFENIVKRIWPHIRLILTVNTGSSFEIYAQKMKKYAHPNSVPTYSPLYGASEGFIGINLDFRKGEYILVPRSGFFEFIPIVDSYSEHPPTLFADQLKVGECYELVVTNLSGLYRYRLGDVIKISGFYHDSTPILEFQYRTGQILNVKGEKTSEQQLFDAIKHVNFADTMVDYTSMDYLQEEALQDAPYYIIFVELENETPLTSDLKVALDEALCQTNSIYESFRVKGSIGDLVLHLVKRGTFHKLKTLMVEEGTGVNQVKIPRVIRTNDHIELFRSSIIQTV